MTGSTLFPRVLAGLACVVALPSVASADHFRVYDRHAGFRSNCGVNVNRVYYNAPGYHVPLRRHVYVDDFHSPRYYRQTRRFHRPRHHRRHVRRFVQPRCRTRHFSHRRGGFGVGFYRGHRGSGFGIHFD